LLQFGAAFRADSKKGRNMLLLAAIPSLLCPTRTVEWMFRLYHSLCRCALVGVLANKNGGMGVQALPLTLPLLLARTPTAARIVVFISGHFF